MEINSEVSKMLNINLKTNVISANVGKQLSLFQEKNNVIIPNDLKSYFNIVALSQFGYNENLFRFYPLTRFNNIENELKNYDGVPDYSNIVNTLPYYKNYYVFADYMFHLFSYAINLSVSINNHNEIIVICGDKFKSLGNSFFDFVKMYNSNIDELQF